jgi:hypothetical protein
MGFLSPASPLRSHYRPKAPALFTPIGSIKFLSSLVPRPWDDTEQEHCSQAPDMVGQAGGSGCQGLTEAVPSLGSGSATRKRA